MIGGFDRGSARQRQAAHNTGHGCIDRNIGLREHRARVVLDDGDACIFHFDHHATERSAQDGYRLARVSTRRTLAGGPSAEASKRTSAIAPAAEHPPGLGIS